MAQQPAQMTQAQKQQMAVNQNSAARQLCVKTGQDMIQAIFTQTYTTGPGTVINIPVRNVGLIKRFYVQVQATVSGTASGPTHTLTPFGPSNFFSNVILTDFSNQNRINDAGWHLTQISTAKRRRVFGSAATTDTPFGYGDNFTNVIAAPATITAVASANNLFTYMEVPCAYADSDLRGALYANVTNATAYLQLTVNPNLATTSTGDQTLAVYKSSSGVAATVPSFTITVYQHYLDQLPIGQDGGPILPLLDLSTAYLLNNTAISNMVANQDNPIAYANFRDFYSTTIIYDQNGTLNVGSDINYFSIQSANYTNIIKYDPYTAALLGGRLISGDDCPKGMYYWDHRHKPISTQQYGNMQLIVNPSSAATSSSTLVGWEALALINMITQAGSLYGS